MGVSNLGSIKGGLVKKRGPGPSWGHVAQLEALRDQPPCWEVRQCHPETESAAFCEPLSPRGHAHSGSALFSVPTAFPGFVLHQQMNSWEEGGSPGSHGVCELCAEWAEAVECVLARADSAAHPRSPPHDATSGLSLPVSEPLSLPSMNEINWMGL